VDFPTVGAVDSTIGGFQDGFVTKLGVQGNLLVYSTYIGGSDFDLVSSVAVGPDGSAYAVGTTVGPDFPVTPGAFDTTLNGGPDDAFATKLDPSGSALAYSTFLGGAGIDEANEVALDRAGAAYVAGRSTSADFPLVNPLVPGATAGSFVTKLVPSGEGLGLSTRFGADVSGLALARDGIVVCGSTSSESILGLGGPLRGTSDPYVAKIALAGETPGVYDPDAAAFFLRNLNAAGGAHVAFSFGPAASLVAFAGDWDGDGDDSQGVYDPATGVFFLRDEASSGPADVTVVFGAGGAVPLAGDWDGDGDDTIGFYDEATGTFFLRHENAPGPADVVVTFGPGGAGVRPLVGDWDGDGADTVGVYAVATGVFFLRDANTPGPATATVVFGAGGGEGLAGDWDGDGADSIGLYFAATGAWFLRNASAPGAADLAFFYGPPGLAPLRGDWDGR
jgi:hypothetical protein